MQRSQLIGKADRDDQKLSAIDQGDQHEISGRALRASRVERCWERDYQDDHDHREGKAPRSFAAADLDKGEDRRKYH